MAASREPDLDLAVNMQSPASLVQQVPMRVLDVSRGGCLFESSQPVKAGRMATVRLALNGGWYVEDVRVTRCEPIPGRASAYHVGAEFLRTRRMPEQSLQAAVARLTAPRVRPEYES